MKNKHFMFNAIVLAVASILAKIIGAFYRIPLTNILGEKGIGLYQLAFPIFAFILVLITGGIGNAITKLTVCYSNGGDKRKVKKLIKISIVVVLVLSLIGTAILFVLASNLGNIQQEPALKYAYFLLALCFVFCAIAAVIKAYFVGLENMVPSSFSGLIEQVAKLVFGLAFAYLFIGHGLIYGVLGAMLGVLISEIVSCAFLIGYAFFKRNGKKNTLEKETNNLGKIACEQVTKKANSWNKTGVNKIEKETNNLGEISNKQIFFDLVKLSIPLTISCCIVPLIFVFDSMVSIKFLVASGYTISTATENFGLLYGVVNSLVNMPVIIAVAMAVALMPQISAVFKEDNKFLLSSRVKEAFNYTVFVGIFFVVIYALFSPNIINFLYSGFTNKPLAQFLLSISAISVLTLSIMQISSSILIGLNSFWWQVFTIVLACFLKVIAEIIFGLTGTLTIEILAIINVITFAIPAILNIFKISSILKIEIISPKNKFAYAISIALMWGGWAICSRLFKNTSSVLFAICVASILAIIYFVVLRLFKVVEFNSFKKTNQGIKQSNK